MSLNRKTITRIALYLIASLFVVAVAVASYHIGHKKGGIDGQLITLPGDIAIFLKWYNSLDDLYIDTCEESIQIRDRIKGDLAIFLLSRLTLYDAERNRFEQIAKSSLEEGGDLNQIFEEYVEKAREVVKSMEFVSLGSAIQNFVVDQGVTVQEDSAGKGEEVEKPDQSVDDRNQE